MPAALDLYPRILMHRLDGKIERVHSAAGQIPVGSSMSKLDIAEGSLNYEAAAMRLHRADVLLVRFKVKALSA